MDRQTSIRIPTADQKTVVEVFPDEVPQDVNDLIDALRAEYAPLRIWRAAAVEYHRQARPEEFDILLNEIVNAMAEPDVEEFYREKEAYQESITEIYNALAASALLKRDDKIQDSLVQEYLKKADADYVNVIKGFHELRAGNIDRVEYYFRNIISSVSRHPSKKSFLYVANIGLGCYHYAKKKYTAAQEHFSTAINLNPHATGAHASVRVALASCLFMLGVYDKCAMAIEKALLADPGNVNALVLLSLLERVNAQKDKNKKKEHYRDAYEYCLIAANIDPSCVMGLNQMANHYFNTWKLLENIELLSPTELILHSNSMDTIVAVNEGDAIRVDGTFMTHVVSVEKYSPSSMSSTEATDTESLVSVHESALLIKLKMGIPAQLIQQYSLNSSDSNNSTSSNHDSNSTSPRKLHATVELKELSQVQVLAGKAFRSTNVPELRAESVFLLGRLYHMRGEATYAAHFYEQTIKYWPDMSPAAMLWGQLLLSNEDFAGAQARFELVLNKHPDDKDCRAYLALVKCLNTPRETTPMDKLKDIAPGFVWEEDLWLLQGQLRLGDVNEHPAALKCLETAKECITKRGGSPDSNLLSNMAVLYHCLGAGLHLAYDFTRRALLSIHQTALASGETSSEGAQESGVTSIGRFRAPENDIFYSWSESVCEVNLEDILDKDGKLPFGLIGVRILHDQQHKCSQLKAHDDVLIGDVIHTIESLRRDESGEVVFFEARSLVRLPSRSTDADNFDGENDISEELKLKKYPLRHKILSKNFNKETLTLCFNYGRILEDLGRTQAAIEMYLELLNSHPGFIECYLRLGKIALDLGRLEQALKWTQQALKFDESNVDVQVCVADIYARMHDWENAKKSYEKICKENHHDPRAMLALGNLYFVNLSLPTTSASKYDGHLKDAYKFYYAVLQTDLQNVFAANGLAMVCAEKRLFDMCREVFMKVRDTSVASTGDVCTNLANVYLVQGRHSEAVLMYQAALKSMAQPTTPNHFSWLYSQTHRFASIYESLAISYFKHNQHSDAIRYMLRSLHLDPSASHAWFNHTFLREEFAVYSLRKQLKTMKDIELAICELETAQRLFSFLKEIPSRPSLLCGQGVGFRYENEKANAHDGFCQENLAKARDSRNRAMGEEQKRKMLLLRQQQEHEERLEQRRLAKLQEQEAQLAERQARQEKAQQKAKQLELLQQSWSSSQPSQGQSGGSSKGKGSKKGGSGGGSGDRSSDRDKDLSDIDFGSSSEDEDAPKKDTTTPASSTSTSQRDTDTPVDNLKSYDDLFGSDDDEDGDGDDKKKEQPSGARQGIEKSSDSGEEEGRGEKPATSTAGRLKRSLDAKTAATGSGDEGDGQLGNGSKYNDDDDEMEFDTNNTTSGVSATPPASKLTADGSSEGGLDSDARPSKQRRVLEDDEDD